MLDRIIYYKYELGETNKEYDGKKVVNKQRVNRTSAGPVVVEVPTEVEDDMCCAKMVISEQPGHIDEVETKNRVNAIAPRYFIRCSLDGIFNPLMYDRRHHTMHIHKGTYKWARVSELCFQYYLQFLRTGKNQFLQYAKRELI